MGSKLEKVYDRWLPKEKAGLIKAMFLGNKGEADQDTRQLYQKNGIGHLLAISGLHVSMIGMGAYQLILVLFRHKRAAVFSGMALVMAYAVMTGFSISTNRAVVMLLLSFLAILAGRTYDLPSALGLSGSLILILHPLEIRNAGFLLSFGAVAGIGFVQPVLSGAMNFDKWETGIKKRGAVIVKGLLASLSVQLVTIPVLLNFFYEYPLYGIILNLIVVPLLSLLAALSAGAGAAGCLFMPAAGIFAGGIYYILEFYEKACQVFDGLPFHTLTKGKPQASYFVIYYSILAGVLLLCHFKKKPFILAGLLMLFLVPVRRAAPGFTVCFLDVGQGDGIYMETEEGFHILADAGSSDRSSLGRYTLEPFLKSRGVSELDYVFLSHLDSDHTSGILELIEEDRGILIGSVVLGRGVVMDEAYEHLQEICQRQKIPIKFIKEGDAISLGGLSLRSLHPPDLSDGNDRNENSLVLQAVYGSFTMLLTGDIGEMEKKLIDQMKAEPYTVLKAAHHGSSFSSSWEFLEKARPKLAVISCGEGNRYGHPGRDVLERLEVIGAKIILTKDMGAITITTNGEDLKLDYFHETR